MGMIRISTFFARSYTNIIFTRGNSILSHFLSSTIISIKFFDTAPYSLILGLATVLSDYTLKQLFVISAYTFDIKYLWTDEVVNVLLPYKAIIFSIRQFVNAKITLLGNLFPNRALVYMFSPSTLNITSY